LTLRASFLRDPEERSRVIACTQTFHEVTESGTSYSKVTEPSVPVSSCGWKKAVSEKLLRNATGAAGLLSPPIAFLPALSLDRSSLSEISPASSAGASSSEAVTSADFCFSDLQGAAIGALVASDRRSLPRCPRRLPGPPMP